jgi:L-fucose mutarotase
MRCPARALGAMLASMLLGLDPVLSPDLLHALAAMGHGDRIALVDANYPATRGRRVIYVPGLDTPRVLQAVLSVLPIDTFIPDPCATMQVVGDAGAVPPVVAEMNAALARAGAKAAVSVDRHAFYAAAETAYAVVQTGERRFYGNILLTKGVVPPQERT